MVQVDDHSGGPLLREDEEPTRGAGPRGMDPCPRGMDPLPWGGVVTGLLGHTCRAMQLQQLVVRAINTFLHGTMSSVEQCGLSDVVAARPPADLQSRVQLNWGVEHTSSCACACTW